MFHQYVVFPGSPITPEELATYKPLWRHPVRFNITTPDNDTLQFTTLPAPSGGPVLNFILNVIAGTGKIENLTGN